MIGRDCGVPARYSQKFVVPAGPDAIATESKRLAAAGVRHVELPIGPAGEVSLHSGEDACRLAAHAIRGAGLTISAIELIGVERGQLASGDAQQRSRGCELVRRAVERAVWLEAAAVVLPAAFISPDERTTYEEAFFHLGESLLDLRFDAQRLCVCIACRVPAERFLLSPMEARDFVDRVNSAWVGASLDLSLAREFARTDDWIRMLGHRVIHAAISGRGAGTRVNEHARELNGNGYDSVICVEENAVDG